MIVSETTEIINGITYTITEFGDGEIVITEQ